MIYLDNYNICRAGYIHSTQKRIYMFMQFTYGLLCEMMVYCRHNKERKMINYVKHQM